MKITYENYKQKFIPSGKLPMPTSKRAKIFAPFDALSGLHAALKNKEKVSVEKYTMTDLDCEELDKALHQISVGSVINVIYYHLDESLTPHKGEYLMITGKLSAFNLDKKYIKIVDTLIPIKDIKSIRVD